MRIGITGISGSLGMALVEVLQDEHVLVGITRDELKAEKIMAGRPNVRCMVVAAGLADEQTLRRAFDGCHFLIHAAALKRISGSVYAAHEVVKVNIIGTQTVMRVARDLGIKKAVVVSSDKAVEATNLYGASKFCMECLAVQENSFSMPKGTSVCAVRYGNVLGSRGSVVHIWREQIRRQGFVTLTHLDMTRFIITMAHAVQVIRDTLAHAEAGDIVVPELPAAKMYDLAEAVLAEYGIDKNALENNPSYIRVTGLRPGGEKLHEQLLSHEELARTCRAGAYWAVRPDPVHRTWKARTAEKGLYFFDRPNYTSDTVQKLTVQQLTEMLADVPVRQPND